FGLSSDMSCCARVKRARNSSAVMGFRRVPNGFKPEKSAAGVSREVRATALEPGTSAREEAVAALCRKRRRVVPRFVGIEVFSSVEKTFSWRGPGLSSRIENRIEKRLVKGRAR